MPEANHLAQWYGSPLAGGHDRAEWERRWDARHDHHTQGG